VTGGGPELFDTEPFLSPEPAAQGRSRIASVAFPVPLHKAFHYLVPEGVVLEPGCRVRAPFGPRRLTGTVLEVFEGVPERKLKFLDSLLDRRPVLPRELLDCAVWMARRYGAPIGECLRCVLPAFIKDSEESAPVAPRPASPPPAATFTLTSGQTQALSSLSDKLSGRRHGAALLYGVPASGKTEVYLRLIRQVAASGGQALFLLPEISLTRPFFDEFSASLDVPVVLWHSKLTARERRLSWLALRRGDIKVVVGARSAALLPFQDLRLIVLDEEQDESFKQEGQSPLYHARDVALHRGKACGAVVVLGSATPSLETWEAARRGEIELIAMPDRVSAVARPNVTVLPLPPFGRCLSEELLMKLRERLERKEQSILLVNRRGFSTLIMCYKCGWVDRCPSCGVAKIQHEERDGSFLLRCHHCEGKGPMPAACPDCKNPDLRVAGTGTQKVVAEVRRALPGARVLRMDRDTVDRERKQDKRIYDRFRAGEADVLVGTKLVAKSFHFPEVTLVGVIDADTMLHMPEFRASERTMQLLAQVAGRAGRAEKKGEVVLQTLQPGHIAIAGAVAGDYGDFAVRELALRRELGYPPYCLLVRLLWTGADEEKLAETAGAACGVLRRALAPSGHEVIGPAPAVLPKARGKFRYHALMKVVEPDQCLAGVLEQARAVELPSGVKLKINVDPYDLF
jgi:primosomal protein N' (replication factor Y)